MNGFDFFERLNEYINSQSYSIKSRIGIAQIDDSLSLIVLPGGDDITYQDGSKDKEYSIQIIYKGKSHKDAIQILNDLSIKMENLTYLPSSNDSYEFLEIEVTALPSFIAEDEKEYLLYGLTISANLYIKKDVI